MDDLPYKAEYAKSSRSSCKACKAPIAKDVLRLAVVVQVCFIVMFLLSEFRAFMS